MNPVAIPPVNEISQSVHQAKSVDDGHSGDRAGMFWVRESWYLGRY